VLDHLPTMSILQLPISILESALSVTENMSIPARLRLEVERLTTILASMFPPPNEVSDFIPDLTGKVAVVTGGNTGLGKVLCRELLAHNARVYMLCRTLSKAQAAIDELKKTTGKSSVYAIQCDLASLPSVHRAAQDLLKREGEIHLLFCNGGLSEPTSEPLTEQNYDMTFGVNFLAHAYLTKLLLPTMCQTAKGCLEGSVRVVHIASSMHWLAPDGGIDYELLRDSPERTKRHTQASAYGQSKWAQIAYAHSLASHYPATDNHVLFLALDPGWLRTDIWRFEKQSWTEWVMNRLILSSMEAGGLTPMYAATAGDVKQGVFYAPWARPGRTRKDTASKELQEKLWDWVELQLTDQPGV